MKNKNFLSWADLGLIVEDAGFSLPDPSETTLTNIPPTKGTEEALALIDGGDSSPGLNYNPEMQGQPDDAPDTREAKGMNLKGKSVGTAKGSQASEAPKGDQSSEDAEDDKPDFLKKNESFGLTWADLGLNLAESDDMEDDEDDSDSDEISEDEQEGGQQGGQQSEDAKEVGECSGRESRLMDHNMAAGEIAVDQDLMREILKAAVNDQPDDSEIDLIVQAIAGCCGEDRTLGVADASAIEDKLRELASGQQSGGQQGGQAGAQMGGQQGAQKGGQKGGQQGGQAGGQQGSDDDFDAAPPGDGEPAGPEGGQQLQGKTKLMSSLGESKKTRKTKGKLDEAWLAGIPRVGSIAEHEEEIDEDIMDLREMARKAGLPNWHKIGK